MKMKEICVIPKMPIHLFRPKSDSACPGAIEHNLSQKSFSALGSKSAMANWSALVLI